MGEKIKFWNDCYKIAIELWQLPKDKRPTMYNKDAEECIMVNDYARSFADNCVDDFIDRWK